MEHRVPDRHLRVQQHEQLQKQRSSGECDDEASGGGRRCAPTCTPQGNDADRESDPPGEPRRGGRVVGVRSESARQEQCLSAADRQSAGNRRRK